jgi:hypothetical protein
MNSNYVIKRHRMKIYIVRKQKRTELQVEDTFEIQFEMVIDKVFEFVEDARNYILLPEDNKPPQKLNLSHTTEENLLYESYNDFEIIEQELLPKQPNPEMKWKFSYKVFEMNQDNENPFSLISEILDDHEFINEDEAKIAAGNILLNNLEEYTILSPPYTPETPVPADAEPADSTTGNSTTGDSTTTEPITTPLPNPPSWSPPWSETTGENDTKIFHGNVYVIYNLTKEQMFQFKVFQK